MKEFFFNDWMSVLRILIVGISAYAATVVLLRVSGKRTLSKMNAFDFVVTVALGSTLATVLLSDRVALAEGVLAIALLVGLQFVVAWLSTKSDKFQGLVKAQPRMLYYKGEFLRDALQIERVTQEEILAALRGQGKSALSQVHSVVLETDGTFSVISAEPAGAPTALTNVIRKEENHKHSTPSHGQT